ncbi:MAG: trans-sulfuration enzyme family protein [Candidatus Zipacnadales bacterium]
MSKPADKEWAFSTRAIHLASEVAEDLPGVPLNVPIVQTANFRFESAEMYAEVINEQRPGYTYTRLGNPTLATFERAMAALEGGEHAVAFASGMAAISATIMAYVRAGNHIVTSKTIYGGTSSLFHHYLPKWEVDVSYVDTRDLEAVQAALRCETALLYTETLGNPTLHVPDLVALAEIAHRAGALLVVDNTFATPYLCRPLGLGADLTIHSATKYISGHADTLGGVVIGCERAIAPVAKALHVLGGALAPFNAFLLCRGLKTLTLRLDRACETAQRIATFLEQHPQIERVYYPGLTSHPDHQIATRQLTAPGAMLAFEVAGGLKSAVRFQERLRLIAIAPSLGECHTLVTHPASTTHRQYSPEERAAAGIAEGLVRLSVGLEEAADLLADLEQALEGL